MNGHIDEYDEFDYLRVIPFNCRSFHHDCAIQELERVGVDCASVLRPAIYHHSKKRATTYWQPPAHAHCLNLMALQGLFPGAVDEY